MSTLVANSKIGYTHGAKTKQPISFVLMIKGADQVCGNYTAYQYHTFCFLIIKPFSVSVQPGFVSDLV